MDNTIYNKFDVIYEERMKRNVKRLFNIVVADINNYKPFQQMTRRRSTTLRNENDFIQTIISGSNYY